MKLNKTFLLIFLGTTAICVALIAAVNYALDYGYWFKNVSFYRGLVRQLHPGRFMGGVLNFDERSFKEALMAESEDVNTLIVGSSTLANLTGDSLKGGQVLNAWVGGAELEDHLATLGAYYYYHKQFPKRVIWGLDAYVLRANSGDIASCTWLRHKEYFDSLMLAQDKALSGRIGHVAAYAQYQIHGLIPVIQIRRLLSLGVLTANLEGWRSSKPRETFVFFDRPEALKGSNLYYADGAAIAYTTYLADRVNDHELVPSKLDIVEERFDHFQKAVDFLLRKQVEVVLFLPPRNPLFFEHMVRLGMKDYVLLEQRLREFASAREVKVWAGYNPLESGLVKEDFYDTHHLRPKSLNGLFQQLDKKTK